MFIDDLESRLANRVQLTTDGHKGYLTAVEDSFGADVDYVWSLKEIVALLPEPTYGPRGPYHRTTLG